MLNTLAKLSEDQCHHVLDSEINSRVQQYEMAYRMQASVSDTLNIAYEPDYVFDLYGPDSRLPGTFAAKRQLAANWLKRCLVHSALPSGVGTARQSP